MKSVMFRHMVFWVVAGLFLGALFQNCGAPYSAVKESPLVYKIDNGQTFMAQELALKQRQAVCRAQHNWHCIVHQFRPDHQQTSTPSELCNGDFCVDATLIHHGTAAALAACADCVEADRQPGGRYHYDDVQCSNLNITHQGSETEAITANSPIPQLALAEALNRCLIAAE